MFLSMSLGVVVFSSDLIAQNGTGTRLIPNGAIKGAHFIETPDFVQVTGAETSTLVFSCNADAY